MGRAFDRRTDELNRRFGSGNWRIRHVVGGRYLDTFEAARWCEEAYVTFLKADPTLLDWLCTYAANVYANARSNIRSGLDYTIQERKRPHIHDIALRRAVAALGRSLKGDRLLHLSDQDPLGRRLCWSRVPFHRPDLIAQPPIEGWWDNDSILAFWLSNQVLQIRRNSRS